MDTPRAQDPAATWFIRPLDTGMIAFMTAGVLHLVMLGFSGVRINDGDWIWLDPYRIRHPSEVGWLAYLGIGLAVALAFGLAVGIPHWAVLRLFGRGRMKHPIGLFFMAAAVVLGFWLLPRLHWAPRVRVETQQPPRPKVPPIVIRRPL
jgi:hypothetical protein